MSQSLTKPLSLKWLKMLLVVVMALGFTGAYAQEAPFELTKFYPDQTTPPQQLKESTSIYVYLTNKTTEALTITALDMSLTQNGKEVASQNIVLKKSTKVAAGMQGTPTVKVMDFPEFFGKCSPGEVTLSVNGVTYTDASGASQHYVNASAPLGSVVYKVSSNPTVTSTKGFESGVLYSFYAEDASNGVLTINFSEPVVQTSKIQSYLEYGDANTTIITEVPHKLSADGMSLTVDFRGMDLSYDVVSQGTVFKDDSGNEYRPNRISLVVTGMETADGTKITSKMTAPNGSVVVVTGAQFSWSYKDEKAPSTGGNDDPQPPVEKTMTVTCNIPEGINLLVDGVNDDIEAKFVGTTATIKGEVAFVRIYPVEPYTITSVKVDGKVVEPGEDGESYFIEITDPVKTIDIQVKKQEVVKMTMTVLAEGVENFDKLQIMNKYGETGKTLATKADLAAGMADVEFTNNDLPLQIFATWEDGKDYEMVVTVEGKVLEPINQGPTSAHYIDINIADGQFLTISLTAAVVPVKGIELTVNDAAGVEVMVDTEEDSFKADLADGKTEVEGAQIIRIYPVEPYAIESVKVNGKTIEAGEDGESYFIEVTEDIETIAIEVKKQQVVKMSMTVSVEGLENFDTLFLMNKYGETGKTLATKATLEEANGKATVEFTNLDLPLQISATWEDGKDYEMLVSVDGEVVEPSFEGSTSAQYLELNVANGQSLSISLKAPVVEPDPIVMTVNDAAGVEVYVDTEEDNFEVEFAGGKAEVKDAMFIRIYPVEPYVIESVKINGKTVEAGEDEESYFIEVTEDIETIAIQVKKQQAVQMSLKVEVEGLENFESLYLMNKYGENGKKLATKETLEETQGVATVDFTNFDLPLQIAASWEDGKDYEMLVTVDGEVVEPSFEGSTSAQYLELNVANGQTLSISLKAPVVEPEPIEISVNDAEGVQVLVDTEDDNFKVEFAQGKAEVEGAQIIRIYPVDPFAIESVEVNGKAVEAGEDGHSYFIEVTEDIKTIVIEVAKQQAQAMTMLVEVEGLDRFEDLVIYDKDGELGKALAIKDQLKEGLPVNVEFTDLDLPLQIFGSWNNAADEMVVTLDDVVLEPKQAEPGMAVYMEVNVKNDQLLTITLKAAPVQAQTISLTVNEPEGVNVMVDTEEDVITVEFAEGKAEVEGAQFIRIYNVEPYIITSVKVDGEEIAATEGGESYFIEATASTKNIDITVEKQAVVEMSMMVTVEGLDRFQELVIHGKQGETGKALAMKDNFTEGEAQQVYFNNFDLPLQVFGSWADGTDYKMSVTLDGEEVTPVQDDSTSALFVNLEPAEGAKMTISLTGAVIPSQSVTLTVNEAAGVNVKADIEVEGEEESVTVEFAEGKAEVEGAKIIRIYNVDPYIITSVKVDGQEIAATEGGRTYFIEMTAAIKNIDITVEEQPAQTMTLKVEVEGLDRFEDLAIFDKDGELGKALAIKDQLKEGEAVNVEFTQLDLPLQIFGMWAFGTNYQMVLTVDSEVVEPEYVGQNSALYTNVNVENGQLMTIALTGAVIPAETIALTVNDAEGVTVSVDTEEGNFDVEFAGGKAEVEGAQFIRIYNVEPYIITSVKVDGEEIAAEEGGEYYFIEATAAMKTIDITVEKQEVVEMTMTVTVEGLDRFEKLAIMSKGGETGKALAMEADFTEGQPVQVYFNNFDLPLEVYGSWADGTDYKMTLTLDGEEVAPVQEDSTSALFVNLEPADGAVMTIALTGAVIPSESIAMTVNEAEGVSVSVDTEEGNFDVEFADGKAEVEGAQFIRIYNVEPYIITSVKVDGEEIAAEEGGEYYFIEATAAIKTIDIKVEKQEVVEMTMTVTVEGLDRFEKLAIMSKGGETGMALAMEADFTEGQPVQVYFNNFDLPLEVYGSWADGTDYKMTLTLDGEEVAPVQEDSTSALFVNLEPAEGSVMTIALTGAVIPSESVTLTVNEPAGVKVSVDTEEGNFDVEFADGKAEVEGAEIIRIYNVDPYIITSVKVNGEEIAAIDGGEYYFIEMTAAMKTIDITVEEQEVVQMEMMVMVLGLDKFEDLVIMDRYGENGKAIASKENFEANAVDGISMDGVYFTNLDLPLQVFGTWADGNDYKMEVMLDFKNIQPVQQGPTSALFMELYVEDGSFMTITLKGETTAINKVDAELKAGKWYNLQGIEVNKANLQRGNVYINSGKKYLVK